MSFFSSSRWNHWGISVNMNTFANFWSLTNIRCAFSVHGEEIIEEFLWRWTHSWMLDDFCRKSDVFLSSRRWDHWRVSVIMNTFANVWPLTNIGCVFFLDRDEIIEEFIWGWTDSPLFDHWRTSHVFSLFIEMTPLKDFSNDEHIRQCLIIAQERMSFFSTSRWDHWRITVNIITLTSVWSVTKVPCPFPFHLDDIIQEFP